MKLKGYSKKRMFGLLLLPALVCSMADGITVSPAMAVTTTVPALSTRTTTVPLFLTDTLINNGTIDLSGGVGTAVTVDDLATGVTIDNNGQIVTDSGYSAIFVGNTASGTTINNYAGKTISALGSVSGAIAYGSGGLPGGPNGLSGTLHNEGIIFAGAKTGSTASNPTGIHIYGNLAGTLENSGEIRASAKSNMVASPWASATAVNAHGIAITGDLTGSLNNTGTASAIRGEINATAAATGTSFASASAHGNSAYGTQMGSLSGSLTNAGTIEANLTVKADATTTSGWGWATAAGSSAYGLSMGNVDATGTLSNTGATSAIRATLDVDATVDGITSASAGASAYPAYGIRMGALNGSLSNDGTIEANVMATATATATGGTTGEAYAYAYGYTAYGIDMNNNNIAAGKSLLNSGTIKAKIDVAATANETVGTDGGSTDAYATAWNAYGLRLGTLDGALDNSGTLSAITAEMIVAATASGDDVKAYASGGSVYGVNLSGGVTVTTGSLNNDGTVRAILDIDATANGVTRATASAQNSAVDGIRLSNNLSGVLENSGTIEAGITMTATAQGDGTANAENAYAYANGSNAYGLNLAIGPAPWMGAYNVDGTLSNTGATSAIRATIDVDATADGITSASAWASGYPALGIKMGELSGSLSNAGTIEANVMADANATATGNGTTGEAYAHAYGSSVYGIDMRHNNIAAGKSLTNSGTISAAIDVAATANETVGTDGGSTDAYATAWNAYGLLLDTLDGALDNSGTLSAITAEMIIAAEATGDDVKAYASGGSVYGVNLIGGVTATTGSLNNDGTVRAILDIDATANGVTRATATAQNYWSYGAVNGIRLGNNLSGVLENSGTIEAGMTMTATAQGDGTANAQNADAYAYGHNAYGLNLATGPGAGAGAYSVDGTLSNTGTASAIRATIDVDATADGITSASAGASAYPAFGIRMGALNGSLSNAGTIEANVMADANATATGNGATGEAYAQAHGYTAYGIDMNNNNIAAGKSLTNSGTISAAIDVAATANETVGTDGGSTDAYATAWNAYGLRLGTLDGALDNSGTLSAITAEMIVAATASGDDVKAYASGGSVYGVNLSGGVTATTGSLNNDGTVRATLDIDATANGVTRATATARNYWSYGAVNGIRLSNNLSGVLENSGTIEASMTMAATAQGTGAANAQNADAYAYGYNAYGLNLATGPGSGAGAYSVDGTLSNTGTASAIRATLDVDATADGITSASAGASAYPAFGIRMGALNGSLSNAGTIEANVMVDANATAKGNGATGEAYAQAHGYTAYGIDMNNNNIAAGKSLLNSGTISAAIDVAATANETVGTDGGSTDAYATAWNAYGLRLGTLDGTLDNSGTLSAITADMGISATAAGDDVKAYVSGGSVYGAKLVDVTSTGSLGNAGTISAALTANATANGVSNATAMAGGVNYGPSTHTDYARRAYGISMGNLAGSLSNGGTIEANLTASANANATAGNAFASAIGSAACGISAVSSNIASTATFFNNGTIKGTLDVDAMATATASATAMADARFASGVSFGDLYATLDNDGTISARVDATAVASGNLANATAKAQTASALYLNAIRPSALLDNSGTIKAEAYATATATGAATANSAADASAYGVFISSLDAGGTLNNSLGGTISAIAKATAANVASVIAHAVHVTTLSGVLNNSGTISGSATLNTVTAPANGYSLYVNAGSGVVNNQTGGLLSGNLYTGGTVQVNNSGTIAIPAGVTANVAGNYHQTAGGVLRVGADSTSNYGKLAVGGTATFDADSGIDVNVATVNTLAIDDILADVVAAGTLSASTLTVTDNSALLNFAATIDGNTIDLNATVVPLINTATGSGADTGLGVAVGSGAGTLPNLLTEMLNNPEAYPGMAKLLDALIKLETDSDVVRAVNSLLPFLNGDQKRALFSALHETRRIVRVRVDDNKGLNSGDDIAVDRNVWGKVFGSRADQDDSRGVSGYEADSYGIIFGADTELNARTRLGAALAYVKSDVDGDTIASQDGEIDSYQAILYGSYALGNETDLEWQVDAAWHENETERAIPFMGVKAKGDYDSWSAHAGIDASHRVTLGEKTTLIPSARVDYARIDEGNYREKGAGALNLKVNGNEVDELIFGVDAKLTHSLTANAMLTANLGVGYDALADEESITTAFAGAPGSAFKTTGVDPEPWLVNAGIGAEFGARDGVQLNVRYDIEGRDDYTNQSVSLKVKVPF